MVLKIEKFSHLLCRSFGLGPSIELEAISESLDHELRNMRSLDSIWNS